LVGSKIERGGGFEGSDSKHEGYGRKRQALDGAIRGGGEKILDRCETLWARSRGRFE